MSADPKKEKELLVLPELGCLATCIGYVSRVHLSMLGVVSTHHNMVLKSELNNCYLTGCMP